MRRDFEPIKTGTGWEGALFGFGVPTMDAPRGILPKIVLIILDKGKRMWHIVEQWN
jgi:hypothetical protein